MADPVAASLRNAPFDDEPETLEERIAVERARAETGPGTLNDDLVREYRLRSTAFIWTDKAKGELRRIDREGALILETLAKYEKTAQDNGRVLPIGDVAWATIACGFRSYQIGRFASRA